VIAYPVVLDINRYNKLILYYFQFSKKAFKIGIRQAMTFTDAPFFYLKASHENTP